MYGMKKRRMKYNRAWVSVKRSTSAIHMKSIHSSAYDESSDDGMNSSCNEGCRSSHANNVIHNEECHQVNSHSDAASSIASTSTSVSFTNDNMASDHTDSDCSDKLCDSNIQIISSDSEEEEEESNGFANGLISWVNTYQIKHNAVDALLKHMKMFGVGNLPTSARTLVKSERSVHTEVKSGMEYIYFGLADSLLKNLGRYSSEIKDTIVNVEIALNIDGLPLFRSSKTCFWPVLCAVMIKPVTVFPVAITCGNSKPKNNDYLRDTIEELTKIIKDGLTFEDKAIRVTLKCVVCDAPAKAEVKSIKLYSGYHGCDKCTQKGTWFGRVTYQQIDNLQLRTDESFRNQTHKEHHHRVSPFTILDIDMVDTFAIDYMHQACLGVMKKLILRWMRGARETRLSATQIEEINIQLRGLQRCIPDCFARKPRGFDIIDRWKATELRQFLLYTGKIVLKGILRKELYTHFLALSVALNILLSPSLVALHTDYAHSLLVYFVRRARELYGNEFLVYNVHSLLHFARDAEHFGSLNECAGFPFENYLQKLKKMVRSGKKPLAQVVKRIHELESTQCTLRSKLKDSMRLYKPNNAYVMDDCSCLETVAWTNELDEQGEKKILCRVYSRVQSLFMEPCDSKLIGIYYVDTRNSHMKLLSRRSICKKTIMIEREEGRKAIFLTILHDF